MFHVNRKRGRLQLISAKQNKGESLKMQKQKVSLLMGSKSDMPVVNKAAGILKEFNIPHSLNVTSAHRSHELTLKLIKQLEAEGTEVFIAFAGGAAHLPGVIAAVTLLPVIGVPVGNSSLKGMDALLSIAQMPKGIPVSTMGIDSAENAAVMAAEILSLQDKELRAKLKKYRAGMVSKILEDNKEINK